MYKIIRDILVLFVIILLSFIDTKAQVKYYFRKIKFHNYTPEWFSYVEDSTALGLDNKGFWDYCSQFVHVKTIFRDSFMYSLYSTRLNHNRDGLYIEKRNIYTGKKLWNVIYDLRNNDRNELPKDIYFNKNGKLEIVGLRYYNKVFFEDHKPLLGAKIATRAFDPETGDLISYKFNEKEDTISETFIGHSMLLRYDSVGYLNIFSGVNYSRDIESKLVDDSGHLLKSSHFEYDSTYQYTETSFGKRSNRRFKLLDDNTFLSTMFTCNDEDQLSEGRYKFKYFINNFDGDFNLLKSAEITDKFHAKNRFRIWVEYMDNKVVVLDYLNEPEILSWRRYYYIFDHSGVLLDSIDTDPGDIDFNEGTIKRLSEDEYLVAGVNSTIRKTYYTLRFLKKRIGEPIRLVKEINMTSRYYYVDIKDIYALDNGDFLCYGVSKPNDDKYAIFEWPFWMYIRGEDLEHGVNVESLGDDDEDAHLMLYPNPAKDKLDIRFGTTTIKLIKVFDLQGQLVLDKKFDKSSSKYIDISQLNKGVYFVNAFVGDKVIAHGKFVKE